MVERIALARAPDVRKASLLVLWKELASSIMVVGVLKRLSGSWGSSGFRMATPEERTEYGTIGIQKQSNCTKRKEMEESPADRG